MKRGKKISKEGEVAITLNDFFSNIVKNFNVSEHNENTLHHRFFNHPTLKAFLKYKNYPSILTTRCATKHLSNFYFSEVDKKYVIKEIKNLKTNKVVQDLDITVNILKENADFFAEQIFYQFNEAFLQSFQLLSN